MSEKIFFTDRFGHKYYIRPIIPDDKINLQKGLKEMSFESRRQRFKSGKNDFNENELKFLTEVDMDNHIAFVAIFLDGDTELPAGVIRGVRDSQNPSSLELAITIIDKYQGKGLGTVLMKTLETYALNHGYTHLMGDLHNSNDKMVRLLQNFSKKHSDFILTHVGDGFLYFEVRLK